MKQDVNTMQAIDPKQILDAAKKKSLLRDNYAHSDEDEEEEKDPD